MMGRIGHESERLMGYLLGYFRLWSRKIFYLVWGKIAFIRRRCWLLCHLDIWLCPWRTSASSYIKRLEWYIFSQEVLHLKPLRKLLTEPCTLTWNISWNNHDTSRASIALSDSWKTSSVSVVWQYYWFTDHKMTGNHFRPLPKDQLKAIQTCGEPPIRGMTFNVWLFFRVKCQFQTISIALHHAFLIL